MNRVQPTYRFSPVAPVINSTGIDKAWKCRDVLQAVSGVVVVPKTSIGRPKQGYSLGEGLHVDFVSFAEVDLDDYFTLHVEVLGLVGDFSTI